MPTRTESILAIAGHELRAQRRGRLAPAFAALFTLLALGIALAGLGASGELLVQGFTRTAVSLLTLSVYLLPLLGLVLGATAFGDEDGGSELLLAQPVGRGEVLVGRALGLALALLGIVGCGFGATAILVAAAAGGVGAVGYLYVVLGASALGLAGLGGGMLLGILARRRGAAVGWALAVWFAAAVLYDLACIGILQVVGDGEPSGWLVAMLALNPLDGVRALGLVGLGADVLLGPPGAALRRLLGPTGGALWVLGSLALWMTVPLVVAARVFRTRDF